LAQPRPKSQRSSEKNQAAQSGKSRFLMPARSVTFTYPCANPHRRFMAVGFCCSILANSHHKSQFVLRKLSQEKEGFKSASEHSLGNEIAEYLLGGRTSNSANQKHPDIKNKD
jgi:hypothetical protein